MWSNDKEPVVVIANFVPPSPDGRGPARTRSP
jgi:hypothetical protein